MLRDAALRLLHYEVEDFNGLCLRNRLKGVSKGGQSYERSRKEANEDNAIAD